MVGVRPGVCGAVEGGAVGIGPNWGDPFLWTVNRSQADATRERHGKGDGFDTRRCHRRTLCPCAPRFSVDPTTYEGGKSFWWRAFWAGRLRSGRSFPEPRTRHHVLIAPSACQPGGACSLQTARVDDRMKLPDIDVVIQAVGQDTSSASISRLLLELEIGEVDFRRYPFNLAGRRIWTDSEGSLQLEFKDIGLLKDIPYHDLDDGPWVLTDAIFWGVRKNKRAYAGSLPHGLSFSMPRPHIRDRLGALGAGNAVEMGFSGKVDIWWVSGLELAVDFSGPGDSIRCASVGIPVDRPDRRA